MRRLEAAVGANFDRTRRCIESGDEVLGHEVLDETQWIGHLCDVATAVVHPFDWTGVKSEG